MKVILVTNWWTLVLRGLIGIALGILAFTWPANTVNALLFLFGAYAIIEGVLAFVSATQAARKREQVGLLVLEGALGLLAGIIVLARPAITLTALVYVIAAWAILTGVLEIAAAVRLRRSIHGEWLMGLFGALSVMFGIAIALTPGLGALTIALWVGTYAFVSGILLTILGLRLRSGTPQASVEPRMAA
jgi:uncharacterized membrane protein HdeD (DUF308 family)